MIFFPIHVSGSKYLENDLYIVRCPPWCITYHFILFYLKISEHQKFISETRLKNYRTNIRFASTKRPLHNIFPQFRNGSFPQWSTMCRSKTRRRIGRLSLLKRRCLLRKSQERSSRSRDWRPYFRGLRTATGNVVPFSTADKYKMPYSEWILLINMS